MFPLATPILLIISFFIFHMSWGFFIESRHKRAITRLFGQYVPPQLVLEMAKNPEQITLDGQSKELTVLFADVRNFTNISEAISPQELTHLMNSILTPMTEAIYRNMGTVDKYMGDAIMAFWGAPVEQADHATKAVLSALGMQKKIKRLSEQLQAKGHPEIAIGIGINTGIMSVGNMGSQYRMAYSVMGDAVNLGSRLEGLSKVYGARIIVSEACQQQAPEFLYRLLDKVRVKGKKEPILILEPMARLQSCEIPDIHKAALLNEAIERYCEKEWLLALETFDKIDNYNDADYKKISLLYRQRIKDFQITAPPENWDCVFNFTEK
jgi:adenylate cyclase